MSNHKYTELANKLREAIKTGIYIEGQKLPSENELASQTGYSRQTVRQAISVLESEGLASRIQGSGTYVKGAMLYRIPTNNIAVVTTYIGEYIFPAILKGIDHVLAENGYTSMLSATRNRVDNERKILTELLQKPIDGLIVEGTKTALPNPNIDLYEQFNRLGVPVVFINGFYSELKNPIYVVADDRCGGTMACEILLRKGHKHIAGIFKSDDIQGHRRYAGYAEALHRAGLSVEDDKVLWYATENRESLIASSVAPVLSGCTAVICYNDEVALQVLKHLQEGVSEIPRELEVVSFDNSTIAKLSAVPFISLSNPKEKIGYLAASKMLNILKNEEENPAVLPWEYE
ncbi:GntR family transcriptional regulator of arabinose operon [Ruminiclostridium sufflavum DSM 19573]|uniref:GntR family transcriptional regulator of arabinose operon n=1 Tax=Ruminiclostridium sufflavum DSM 19573 TaxID=1121337 RepID=A0A318YA87_9FIRM|nr:GntR family transcriptional regulator [Ruminiclostridium sufflavum]PYG89393.1 GntR family transcriptional regulator of arabinose operon [Ruminiclostridium sufflavum DSM 19573]